MHECDLLNISGMHISQVDSVVYLGSVIRQRSTGRCQVAVGRSRSYRQLAKLEDQLLSEHWAAERYRQRYQRLLERVKVHSSDTPRTKTRKLLRNMHVSNVVRKTLVFHRAVIDNLRDQYRQCHGLLEKRKFNNLLMGRTVQRCRMQMYYREKFGFSKRRFELTVSNKCRGRSTFIHRLKESVINFYQRDDVSRATAGKKETVTAGKTKHQKRFLTACKMFT